MSQPVPASIEKSPFNEITLKHNVRVDFHPFIRVQGVSLKEFMSQRVEVLDHSAVIFTSRTTVDHFFRICEEARIAIPETMKYFCMTEAVALYLQKYIVYRKRKIFFANGSFTNFMELVVKHKDENFLIILSEPHNPELPFTMEKLKMRFHKVILSRTVANDLSSVDLRSYDMLAFYSPSEISILVSQYGKEGLPTIAAFGESTARAAIESGLEVGIMAPTPQSPSMTKAVDLYLTQVAGGMVPEAVVLAHNTQSEDFIKQQEAKASRRSRLKVSDKISKGKAKKNSKTAKTPDARGTNKMAVKGNSAKNVARNKISTVKKAAPLKTDTSGTK